MLYVHLKYLSVRLTVNREKTFRRSCRRNGVYVATKCEGRTNNNGADIYTCDR